MHCLITWRNGLVHDHKSRIQSQPKKFSFTNLFFHGKIKVRSTFIEMERINFFKGWRGTIYNSYSVWLDVSYSRKKVEIRETLEKEREKLVYINYDKLNALRWKPVTTPLSLSQGCLSLDDNEIPNLNQLVQCPKRQSRWGGFLQSTPQLWFVFDMD